MAIATLQHKCECTIDTFSSTVLIPSDRKSLEESLAQLNTEHVEVLVRHSLLYVYIRLFTPSQNELVKARLRNEETESELVRYKLL